MDIKLGNIGLTKEQQENAYTLASGVVKGFGSVDGEVTVVTARDLTSQEKSTLIAQLQALPNTSIQKEEKKNRKKGVLQKLKLDEADIRGLKELLQDGHSD